MNLKIILSVLLFSLISCKSMKLMSAEEISTQEGSLSFDDSQGFMLVDININDSLQTFMFDTGATFSLFIDSNIVDNFRDSSFKMPFGAKGGDGKRAKTLASVHTINSSIFDSKNKVLLFVNFPSAPCTEDYPFSGILGIDMFIEDSLPTHLNFSKNQIENISQNDKLRLVGEGYTKLKSDFKLDMLYVFIKIDGQEYELLFDTGFIGNIALAKTKDAVSFSAKDKVAFEGMLFKTAASATNGDEVFYSDVPTAVGEERLLSEVLVSNSLKKDIVGYKLIRCFDWIIDEANEEVYFRKNNNEESGLIAEKLSYNYKVINTDDKLLIAVKRKQKSTYQLDDQIISVNGQKVTPENICEVQTQLNSTPDWSDLKIEVKAK